MKIGVVTTYHLVPVIIRNLKISGCKFECLLADINQPHSFEGVSRWIKTERVQALVFAEPSYLPDGISYQSIVLADKINGSIPTFFALLESRSSRVVYSLWRWVVWPGHEYRRGIQKVHDSFWGRDYSLDGTEYRCSGGDSGLEDRACAARSGSVVPERDWQKITETILNICIAHSVK